ncbi:hypothetical protein AX774_g2972, partial [Zancudomyces culisetae]
MVGESTEQSNSGVIRILGSNSAANIACSTSTAPYPPPIPLT